jgi:hypothetical protein
MSLGHRLPLPNQSTDGVGRLACPPVDRGCPAPHCDLPADAAPVLTPEVLDRDTAAGMAGSIVASIFEHFRRQRRQRRPTVIDVDSVACALLPLAALPPAWLSWTLLGLVALLICGGLVLTLFMPAERRQRVASFRIGDLVEAVGPYHPQSRLAAISKPWVVTAVKQSFDVDGETIVNLIRINGNYPWLPEEMFRAENEQVPGRLDVKVVEPVCLVPRCFVAEPARDFIYRIDPVRETDRPERSAGEREEETPTVPFLSPEVRHG